MFNQILKTLKNELIIKDNESVGSFNEKKSEGIQSIPFNQSLKGSFINNNDNGQGISSNVKSFKRAGNAGVVYLNSEGSNNLYIIITTANMYIIQLIIYKRFNTNLF